MQVQFGTGREASLLGMLNPDFIASRLYDNGYRAGNMRGGVNAVFGIPEGVHTRDSSYKYNADKLGGADWIAGTNAYTGLKPTTNYQTPTKSGGNQMAGGLMGGYSGVKYVTSGYGKAVDDAVNQQISNAAGRQQLAMMPRNLGGTGEGVHNMGAQSAPNPYKRVGVDYQSAFHSIQSGLKNVTNPYGKEYGRGLLGGMVSNINQGFTDTTKNMREQMAARGMSQSGLSGVEAQGLMKANIARDNAVTQAQNTADTTWREKAADFDMRKQQALDNFNVARQNYDLAAARAAVNDFIAMAQNDRQQALHPFDVQAAQVKSQYAPQMLQAELDTARAQASKLGASAEFDRWMMTPNQQYGGKTPFQYHQERAMNAPIEGAAIQGGLSLAGAGLGAVTRQGPNGEKSMWESFVESLGGLFGGYASPTAGGGSQVAGGSYSQPFNPVLPGGSANTMMGGTRVGGTMYY